MEAGGVAAENAPTGRPSAAPAPRSFVASKTRRGFLATSLKEKRRREFAVLKCHFSAAHGPPSTAARVPAHGGDMASLFLATSQGAAPPASPPHAALTALRSTLFDSPARPTGGRKRERPANERAAAPASPKRARASDAPGTPASRFDVGDEPPRAHAAPPSGDAEPGDAGAQRDTAGENTAGAAAAAASPAPSPPRLDPARPRPPRLSCVTRRRALRFDDDARDGGGDAREAAAKAGVDPAASQDVGDAGALALLTPVASASGLTSAFDALCTA